MNKQMDNFCSCIRNICSNRKNIKERCNHFTNNNIIDNVIFACNKNSDLYKKVEYYYNNYFYKQADKFIVDITRYNITKLIISYINTIYNQPIIYGICKHINIQSVIKYSNNNIINYQLKAILLLCSNIYSCNERIPCRNEHLSTSCLLSFILSMEISDINDKYDNKMLYGIPISFSMIRFNKYIPRINLYHTDIRTIIEYINGNYTIININDSIYLVLLYMYKTKHGINSDLIKHIINNNSYFKVVYPKEIEEIEKSEILNRHINDLGNIIHRLILYSIHFLTMKIMNDN